MSRPWQFLSRSVAPILILRGQRVIIRAVRSVTEISFFRKHLCLTLFSWYYIIAYLMHWGNSFGSSPHLSVDHAIHEKFCEESQLMLHLMLWSNPHERPHSARIKLLGSAARIKSLPVHLKQICRLSLLVISEDAWYKLKSATNATAEVNCKDERVLQTLKTSDLHAVKIEKKKIS